MKAEEGFFPPGGFAGKHRFREQQTDGDNKAGGHYDTVLAPPRGIGGRRAKSEVYANGGRTSGASLFLPLLTVAR